MGPFKRTALYLLTAICMSASASAAEFYEVRDGIPNSQHFLKNDRVGNQYFFFIGNSVLKGTGLKDQGLRYSNQIIQGAKKYFPNARPIEKRYSEDGGSWFGLYRTSGGQPVFGEIISSGHLAILDFAADDRDVDIEEAKANLEGLVRQIRLYRATHSQILIYTLTPEMLESYRAGEMPEYIQVSEQIADYYSVPSLNLAKYAADKIIAGDITFEEFSSDGINPTDAGAKVYAEAIGKFMDDLMTTFPVPEKTIRPELPEPLFPATNDQGRIVAYENPAVKRMGSWEVGQESPIPQFRHVLESEKAGDTLSLKFKGSEIGIIDVAGEGSAAWEYSVDGADFKPLPASDDGADLAMRPVSLKKGLDRDKEHELVLKVASSGAARLGGFLLNGEVEDAYAGMDKLEKIDAIYAAMDPVVYTPEAGRFDNIPETMNKLRNGGELRMVLLGDSIIGNTSNSLFELLMMRQYPKSNVKKITSLRSSTGCTYYQEENRVEDYVLRHDPDLLVIGGISNKGDAEAVRSVIKQVRAKKPDTEVLLLTPVFGSVTEKNIKDFTPEIDTATDNFRFNMQKVAAEENCAFFDMSGPWWSYISNSGKTYGWFKGDAVHANQRGCQTIGRLLESWWKE